MGGCASKPKDLNAQNSEPLPDDTLVAPEAPAASNEKVEEPTEAEPSSEAGVIGETKAEGEDAAAEVGEPHPEAEELEPSSRVDTEAGGDNDAASEAFSLDPAGGQPQHLL